MENEENKRVNKKTGAKTAKKVISALVLTAAISAITLVGSAKIQDSIETREVTNIINAQKYNSSLILDDNIVSNKAYDSKLCSGEKLEKILNNEDITCANIGDQYFSNNGDSIYILTVEITKREVIEPNKYNYNGTTMYLVPQEYTLEYIDGKMCGVREYTYQEDILLPKDYDFNSEIITDENVVEVTNIGYKEVYASPYDELENYDFISDIQDDAVLDENGQVEATLKLVHK